MAAPIPPPVGGITVFVERRLAVLRRNDASVSVRDWKKMGYLRRAAWILEILSVPGVPTFELHWYETWPMAAILLRPGPSRVVCYLHSARILHVLTGWRQALARRFVERCDEVVAVTDTVAGEFRRAGWTLPPATRVAAPWIPPDPAEEADIVAGYPATVRAFLDTRRPLLVMQGSEGWHRGLDLYGTDLAVELLLELRRSFPGVGLLVARPSPGSRKYRSHLADLEGKLKTAGCLDALCVLGEGRRLWPAIARADCFLRPTADDGDSLSVREALWFGVPVVASDAVPRPDGVACFRSRDPDDFVRAVRTALASAPDRPGQKGPEA